MNILFLMKPLNSINPKKDTSLLFMQAAEKQGHSIYYLPQGNCSLTPTGATFDCIPISCTYNNDVPLRTKTPCQLSNNDVDIIFIRTDPPVDNAYIHDLWILQQLPDSIRCINSPTGILTINEKIWTTQFKSLIPNTWISKSISQIKSIIKHKKTVIIKPTNNFGGQGIFKLSNEDPNLAAILETATQNETQYIVIQAYIKESQNGDKRILLCNGNPIGALLRVHSPDDHRNNFFAGGSAAPATITDQDTKIITKIKPYLLKNGLNFVGIDIIGDYLIEINVTSPTCLQELNQLTHHEHEHDILCTLLQSN